MRTQRAIAVVTFLAMGKAACGTEASPESVEGRAVYEARCASCHGSHGAGGVGPALDRVVETFPDCADQVRWIALGSELWLRQEGSVYGATFTPVGGGMPTFRSSLTTTEIAAVASFTRVAYGGEPDDDC